VMPTTAPKAASAIRAPEVARETCPSVRTNNGRGSESRLLVCLPDQLEGDR
jgi:hypothetical protein